MFEVFQIIDQDGDGLIGKEELAMDYDPERLLTLLSNLLSNAIKYTQQGEVLVGVRRHGDKLRFEVHDTGASWSRR